MKINELSVGKVLVATDSAQPLNDQFSSTNFQSTPSAQASSSATPKADASIGSGTIAAGNTSVIINNNQITQQSKVFVTATTPTGGQTLIVAQKQVGQSFTVEIEKAFLTDVTFDYWIIN